VKNQVFFILFIFFISSCQKFEENILVQEQCKPSLDRPAGLKIVFTYGFHENEVSFKIDRKPILESNLTSEETSGMASAIEYSLREEGDTYQLEIDGQEWKGYLDRDYDNLVILIKEDRVHFRYSNGLLHFE
jgi:hypothetical protein